MSIPHEGMPPFEQGGPPVSFFEFWPMWAFYPPVLLYVFWLMLRYRSVTLPTIANPSFPGGGMVGESKAQILSLLMAHIPEWVAPSICVQKKPHIPVSVQATEALSRLEAAGLQLPVVAKPDIGCRGVGVWVIRDVPRLEAYMASFPDNADFVLQRLVNFEGEAGIFYCREPGQAQGKIISVTLKYFPYVYGDGTRTLQELILADPRAGLLPHLYLGRHRQRLSEVLPAGTPYRLAFAGSHSRGTIFRNGNHLVTPAMSQCFDELAKRIPDFYFGRFDIRFQNFADVQNGGGFTIVEANGAGAESTHIWDRKTTLFTAWKDLMFQYRMLFKIGAANRRRGLQPLGIKEFFKWNKREKMLTPHYPSTE